MTTARQKLSILDESESDEGEELKINTEYAATYKRWKEKEALKKLEDKYSGENLSEVSSSDSEVEDDMAEEVTPTVEKGFLAALSALKSQNPKIYKNDVNFYPEASGEESNGKMETETKKQKPMFLKDYERKVILEKAGKYSDEEDEAEEKAFEELPYTAQQHKLKKSFKLGEESDVEDDLFKVKEKTAEQKKQEEEDYIAWMKGRKDSPSHVKEGVEDLKYLHDYWNDPKLDEGEKFLRDYILDRKYRKGDDAGADEDENEDSSSDEDELEKQEIFERKYNFRFEEPDPEFIKSYPRTIEQSLRRKDDKRKQQRDLHKRNKEEAKQKKKEELKLLKKLKRQEILEKIERLKEVTGNTDISINPEDIDGDFDPAEYDKKMKEIFADNYYESGETDAEKPQFSDSDEDPVDNPMDWDEWEPTTSVAQVKSVANGSSETAKVKSDEEENGTDEPVDAESSGLRSRDTKSRKRRKRKHLLTESLEKKKPVFDPNEKTFEEYLDEYYKLDCEDVVADMPVRFKYRKVVPNDFGLSTEEILAAPDPELNAWVSVKRMSQYRREEDEKYDLLAYQQKAANSFKKKKVLRTLYEEKIDEPETVKADEVPAEAETDKPSGEDNSEAVKKRRRRKKKEKESPQTEQIESESETTLDGKNQTPNDKQKKQINSATTHHTHAPVEKMDKSGKKPSEVKNSKKSRYAKHANSNTNTSSYVDKITDDRLDAYGLNPKKVRNKFKFGKK